jgi:oxygen-dependent protoporphyrinogen oxidase
MGVLFADSAFPHHAPEGYRLLRAFIGGTRTPDVNERSADELLATTRQALRECPGRDGRAGAGRRVPVSGRNSAVLPRATARGWHRSRGCGRTPGLHLAGNYLEGVSINDCIKLGKARGAGRVSATPVDA